MASKSTSAQNPNAIARFGSNARGQPDTMRSTKGSVREIIKSTAFCPTTRRNDSICSATVQLTPGRFKARRPHKRRTFKRGGMGQKRGRRFGRGKPMLNLIVHGQIGCFTIDRFADDT